MPLRKMIASGAMLFCGCLAGFGAELKLFEDGQSEYQIVVPDAKSAMAEKCVEELNYHIKEATGVELPVVKASQRDKAKPAIILCTPPAENPAACETPNGFVIQTAGSDIHIFGDDLDGYGFTLIWKDDAFDRSKGRYTRYGTLFGAYEFLEQAFGVRWLWPGKLGEYIPKTANAVWKDDLVQGQQKLIHSRIRYQPWRRDKGWADEKNRVAFERATYMWILRNRMVRAESMEYGHSYVDWFKKYGKEYPEIFNLLPNGKRVSDPLYSNGAPSVISMCVSNEKLVEMKIRQWLGHRDKLPFVNLAENDTAAKCVCPACLALDVPNATDDIDFEHRLEIAAKRFAAKDHRWYNSLGSLTDRYCSYYNKVLAEAKKIDPNVKAVAYAYGNISKPPVKTKISGDIIMEYVPRIGYPWKTEQRRTACEEWQKWREAGASMLLRPNYTLRGHNFPIYYADELAEDFSFAWKNGLVATDFDSLIGQYATQGLNTYACARIHMKGYLSKEEIFSEYFRAFGPAEKEIREYYGHLKKIAGTSGDIVSKNFLGLNFAGFAGDFLSMPAVYTPEVLDQCLALLDKAEAKTAPGSVERGRVEFLKNGIRHAELNSETCAAYREYMESGDIVPFARAIRKLDAFRAQIEGDFGADMGFLRSCENYAWNRRLIEFLNSAVPLDAQWLIRFDPEKTGEKDGWFKPGIPLNGWTLVQVGKSYNVQEPNLGWVKAGGTDYTGISWYKTSFRYTPKAESKKVEILFGAVDEACKVYFNGKELLDRPYPYQGNNNSWQEPFAVDVTEHLKKDGENDLTVMVVNRSGQGGLFRPVFVREK